MKLFLTPVLTSSSTSQSTCIATFLRCVPSICWMVELWYSWLITSAGISICINSAITSHPCRIKSETRCTLSVRKACRLRQVSCCCPCWLAQPAELILVPRTARTNMSFLRLPLGWSFQSAVKHFCPKNLSISLQKHKIGLQDHQIVIKAAISNPKCRS